MTTLQSHVGSRIIHSELLIDIDINKKRAEIAIFPQHFYISSEELKVFWLICSQRLLFVFGN